jgi:hypothetical protein
MNAVDYATALHRISGTNFVAKGHGFHDETDYHPTPEPPVPSEPEIFLPDEPITVAGIVELVLKYPARLNRLIRDTALQGELVPRFMAIELAATTLFGIVLSIVLASAGVWPRLHAVEAYLKGDARVLIEFIPTPASSVWLSGAALKMILAYDIGLIAAIGICLPSLYFYGLLAGVRMTMLDVVVQAIKAQTAKAVALVGILPIYVAVSLGMAVFQFPTFLVHGLLWLGLILPFVAGLWGVASLYTGLMGLADTLSADRRCRRECFLRRLLLSWTVCWTAVTPVMIYTLWEYMTRI